MQRRISMRGVALGATLAVGAAATPQDAEAKEQAVKPTKTAVVPGRVKPSVKVALRQIEFKGSSFEATQEQQEAFDALPDSIKAKLKPGVPGKVMPVEELRELAEIAKAGVGGRKVNPNEVAISTVMCPW